VLDGARVLKTAIQTSFKASIQSIQEGSNASKAPMASCDTCESSDTVQRLSGASLEAHLNLGDHPMGLLMAHLLLLSRRDAQFQRCAGLRLDIQGLSYGRVAQQLEGHLQLVEIE